MPVPVCGYSVPELEPKMFSFNSPAGACPACDGLGYQEIFDPARVVLHPQLSLAGGAIRGWIAAMAYYFQMIQALAQHYRFDIEAPWVKLAEKIQYAVLHGSGEEPINYPLRGCTWPHGETRASLRGHHPEPRTALPRNRIGDGA